MEKVLIVDDELVGSQLDYAKPLADTYDLTAAYRASGGNKDLELLLLGEPTFIPEEGINGYGEKYVGYRPRLINLERAVSLIKSVNPDVLLLDLNFYSKISDSLSQDFCQSLQKRKTFSIECIDAKGTERKVTFPFKTWSEKPITKWISDFMNSQDKFAEQGVGDPSTRDGIAIYEAQSALRAVGASLGGSILGKTLSEAGIRYSFWSNELTHGVDAISTAYTLNLISEADIRSLYQSYCNSPLNDYGQSTQLVHSESGNIFFLRKDNFYTNGQDKFSGLISVPECNPIMELDRMIDLARTYQSK